MVPNSQQMELRFIPETGLCAAIISLSYGWSGEPASNKVRRIMTVG
jgi:hypothetical protein